MKSVTRFIERMLKLKVNKDKSAVLRPYKLKLVHSYIQQCTLIIFNILFFNDA